MLSPFDTTCPRCERLKSSAPKQHAAIAPVVPAQSAEVVTNFACIVCGNESVQKISAIYQSGTWSAKSKGSAAGSAFIGPGDVVPIIGNTTTATSGASNLAKLLAPPIRPIKSDPLPLIIGAILIAPFIVMFSTRGMDMISYTAPLLAFEAFIGFQAIKQFRQFKAFQYKDKQWQSGISQWNQLFYCSRCDQVYNPQTRQHAPSYEMSTIL